MRAGIIIYHPKRDSILTIYRFKKNESYYVLPGGQIENGESPLRAAIREIKEELDCIIKPTKFALELEYQYSTFYLKMSCFEAVISEGTPKLLEHNDAKWLTKSQLDDVDWISADIKAVNYLKETMED